MSPVGMPNTGVWKKAGAVITFVTVALILVASIANWGWSEIEIGLVTVEVDTGVFLIFALVAHFQPGTKEERIAVGGAFVVFVSATTALVTGFEWVEIDTSTVLLIGTLATAFVGLFAGANARDNVDADVTPTNSDDAPTV